MKKIPIWISALFLLSGCSEFEKEQEVLINHTEDNGSYINLSTGEDAVEEAAEKFYNASNTLSDEDKTKELSLIDELGGFKAYYDFVDNAEAVHIVDMYEKHGLDSEAIGHVNVEKKSELNSINARSIEEPDAFFCEWFGAGCDDDDDGPIETTSSSISACPDRFTGSAAGRTHTLSNRYGNNTRVSIAGFGLPVSARTTDLKGVRLNTTPINSACHTDMRKIFDRSQYYRDRYNKNDYEVGHLVPARLGGYDRRANLTLQRRYINQSIIKIIEGAVAHCNDGGFIQSSGNSYGVAVGYALNGDLAIPSSYDWNTTLTRIFHHMV